MGIILTWSGSPKASRDSRKPPAPLQSFRSIEAAQMAFSDFNFPSLGILGLLGSGPAQHCAKVNVHDGRTRCCMYLVVQQPCDPGHTLCNSPLINSKTRLSAKAASYPHTESGPKDVLSLGIGVREDSAHQQTLDALECLQSTPLSATGAQQSHRVQESP